MYTYHLAPGCKTLVIATITTALLLLALLSGGTVQAQAENLAPAAPQGMTAQPLTGIQSTAGGFYHACALMNTGGVKCWGANYSGQLGDGTTTDRWTATDVSGLTSGVQAIAASWQHTCALTTGGGVMCWGGNASGRLGDGTTITRLAPVPVSGLTSGLQAITVGMEHTCALTTGGGVMCWGDNKFGQLGDGTRDDRVTPVDVSGLSSGVQAITAGSYHTCAVLNSGGVQCWGFNGFGQLGDGSTTDRLMPTNVSGLSSGVQSVSAGGYHTCAVLSGGGLKCWGFNAHGQLGNGTKTPSSTPVDVINPPGGVQMVSVGWGHTCALTTGGGVKCWGLNEHGEVGDGTTTNRAVPTDVSGLANDIVRIAAGSHNTCAVTSSGSAKCWSDNFHGQLGDGATTNPLKPGNVTGLAAGVQTIAAGRAHTCAVTTDGGVQCWGDNNSGQLGDGSIADRSIPAEVSGLSNGVQSVAAGGYQTCALTTGGGVKCWGYNQDGQLGDGTTNNRPAPVDVSGLSSDVQAITGGLLHTCALTTGGGVKCWGYNLDGQLGDGTDYSQLTPVDVAGLTSGVQAVAAGVDHTCALTTGGGVKCWGENSDGQLGDGTTTDRLEPVDVTGLTSGVEQIAAGDRYTCAVSAGAIKCWGRNENGRLGNNSTSNHSAPVNVVGLDRDAQMVAAGGGHTCRVTTGGGLKCWGTNFAAQLGDGTALERLTPVDVIGLASGVQMVVTGGAHTCALTTGGGVRCWGSRDSGQVGVNPILTPVDVIDPNALPDQAAQITSTPVTSALVGQPYAYAVAATGVPAPTFSLVTAPTDMTIDPASGLIEWMPTAAGTIPVTVRADNGVEPPAEQSFTITVSATPQAAQITSSPVTKATVGQPYTYGVIAGGAPAPTFSLVTAPPDMTINLTSGLIQWTPTAIGSFPVTVRADNGVEPPAEQSFTITVTDTPVVEGADLFLPLINK